MTSATKTRKTAIQKLAILVVIVGGLLLILGGIFYAISPKVEIRGETISCNEAVVYDMDNLVNISSGKSDSAMDECEGPVRDQENLGKTTAGIGLAVFLVGLIMLAITHSQSGTAPGTPQDQQPTTPE